MFSLNPQSTTPLVLQVVDGFRHMIEDGSLRAGAKAPSIRQFAHAHGVSVYTVVDAYDRLVAQGFFVSRPHSGFFVRRRGTETQAPAEPPGQYSFDSMWYMRRIFENRALRLKPGCGWLPGDWLFSDGVRRALRALAAEDTDLGGYGEPKGYLPLRQMVRDLLAEHEIVVTAEQVLLTHGSTQAMDLVARRLVRSNDAVLVDEPGYANLLSSLRFLGARLIGAPRTPQGYDLEVLKSASAHTAPKCFLPNPDCKARPPRPRRPAIYTACCNWPKNTTSPWSKTIFMPTSTPNHAPRWPALISCAGLSTSAAFLKPSRPISASATWPPAPS